jgi:hypothetical protein
MGAGLARRPRSSPVRADAGSYRATSKVEYQHRSDLALRRRKNSFNQPLISSARRCSAFDQISAWSAKSILGNSGCIIVLQMK